MIAKGNNLNYFLEKLIYCEFWIFFCFVLFFSGIDKVMNSSLYILINLTIDSIMLLKKQWTI